MTRDSRAKLNLGGAFPLALTALFAILSFFPGLVPSRGALFLFFFLYLVIVPGALLARRFAPAARPPVFALASLALGTAVIFAVLFVLALFKLDITLVRIVVPPLVVLLAIAPRRAPVSDRPSAAAAGARADRAPAILLLVLAATCCALILGAGDPLLYTSDSADHIAYIRTIARTHEVFPERFYYADGGILTRDIRKGLAHALWGSLAALAGEPAASEVWPLVAAIGSTFFLVALFAAGILIFGSAWIGLLAALLAVLLYDGGLSRYSLVSMGTGYGFGKAPYVAALAFGLSWLSSGKRSILAIAAASAFAAAGAHIAHFAVLLFLSGVFALSALLRRGGGARRGTSLRRIGAFAASAFAISAPYLAMRYLRDYAPNNAIHTHVQGVLHFTGALYVMNPIVFAQAAGPLGFLSLLALVALWRRGRGEERYRLLAHGIGAVYLLLFVPLWFPFLLRKLSYLLIRFEFAVPSMLVSAFLLAELVRALRGGARSRAAAFAGLALFAAVAGPPLARTLGRFAYSAGSIAATETASFRDLADLFAFVEGNVPPGSVIAADPVTSFGIPAFTDGYAMVPFDQHATPNDSTAIRRIVDARRMLNPWTSPEEVATLLDAYGARCLVVNGRMPASVGTAYWKSGGSSADSAAAGLRRCPAFTERFREKSLSLFEYDRERAKACASAAPPFLGEALDERTAAAAFDSRMPGIRIARAGTSLSRAARGDTLSARVVWVATGPVPFSSYVAHLRFETGFPTGPLYRPAWGKPYRKIRERLAGERYRFRIDFQPLAGMFPPNEWPPLREIRDRVTFAIPLDVAPGIYTIHLRMAERPQYPNYALTDLFTDDDQYRGVEVGRIEIE